MPTITLPELIAMQQVAEVVSNLTPAERRRVGLWLAEYAAHDETATPAAPLQAAPAATAEAPATADAPAGAGEVADPTPEVPVAPAEATFADVYAAAAPRKGAQRAAVAGWWLETVQGQESWKASEINKLLKSVGVSMSSMSIVLSNAVKAGDPLIAELGRQGDSERSRKTFCLTPSGRAYVEALLNLV